MSSALLEMVAKRALKDAAKKNINSKDPYFEEVQVYGRDGRPTGRVRKQKKGIPPGLSQNDGQVLKRVRKRAYHLDMSLFNCCGIRFGWSSLIGIIPVVGDAIDLFMAWLVVKSCMHVDGGLPQSIQYRMYLNIVLDFAVGLVPFIGDVADALFRANTRNAWILEEYLLKKAETERRIQQEKQANGGDRRPSPPGRGPSAGAVQSYGPGVGPGSDSRSSQPARQKSWWSRNRDTSQDPYSHDQEMGIVDRNGSHANHGRL